MYYSVSAQPRCSSQVANVSTLGLLFMIFPSRFFTSIEPEFLLISLPHLPWPDLGVVRHRGASCFPKTLNKLIRWQDLR